MRGSNLWGLVAVLLFMSTVDSRNWMCFGEIVGGLVHHIGGRTAPPVSNQTTNSNSLVLILIS